MNVGMGKKKEREKGRDRKEERPNKREVGRAKRKKKIARVWENGERDGEAQVR